MNRTLGRLPGGAATEVVAKDHPARSVKTRNDTRRRECCLFIRTAMIRGRAGIPTIGGRAGLVAPSCMMCQQRGSTRYGLQGPMFGVREVDAAAGERRGPACRLPRVRDEVR